jgi:hypothetical protein
MGLSLHRLFTILVAIRCVKWKIRVPNFFNIPVTYRNCEYKSINTLKEKVTASKSIFTTPMFARQRLIQNSYTEYLESQTEGLLLILSIRQTERQTDGIHVKYFLFTS